MIDINELRQLAQVATPGPWLLRTVPTSAGLCHIISAADWRGAFIYGDGLRIGVDDSLPKAQELAANAHLIAAANPAVISELLNRLEAAERERDWHAERCEDAMNECAALRAKIEAMERQEPLITVLREPDYWSNGHFHKGTKPYISLKQLSKLKIGDNLYALPGAQPEPSEQDESVRKAWSRFSNELHRSPDAPYPGMSEAFEQHFSQSFTDRDWRVESGVWAAAWKAAKRHGAQPAPSVPEGVLPERPA